MNSSGIHLGYLDPQRLNYGWRLSFDLSEILTMIITAGGDLDRALRVWDAAADPGAIAHMVAIEGGNPDTLREPYLDTPFLDQFRSEAEKIGAFVMRPELVTASRRPFSRQPIHPCSSSCPTLWPDFQVPASLLDRFATNYLRWASACGLRTIAHLSLSA